MTSDPIEIEVNHFWQDDDPIHMQIYLQFQLLYAIIVACVGAFTVNKAPKKPLSLAQRPILWVPIHLMMSFVMIIRRAAKHVE